MYEEFSVKRHYQTKHANASDKLSGSKHSKKLKQLEAVLASQRFFTQAAEVAMLIAKHGKPFTIYGYKKIEKCQERLLALRHFHIKSGPL